MHSDVKYYDAQKSGQLSPVSNENKELIFEIVNTHLKVAYNASFESNVDAGRLELHIYDSLMKKIYQMGILISPDMRKEIKLMVKTSIAQGCNDYSQSLAKGS